MYPEYYVSVLFVGIVFLVCQLSREQQELTTVLNLRDLPPKKAVNLNYSCLDIQWRPGSGTMGVGGLVCTFGVVWVYMSFLLF